MFKNLSAGLGLLSLCACVETAPDQTPSVQAASEGSIVLPVVEQLPPGYPPKMGSVKADQAGVSTVFTTYDFSVGAFDASAWFDSEQIGGGPAKPRFSLIGYPGEDHEAKVGRLHLVGYFPAPPKAGAVASNARVEITHSDGFDGARLSSRGSAPVLVIDSFTKENPTNSSGYGHVTGHFSGHLCPTTGSDDLAVSLAGECFDLSGTFDTDVQYSP